MSDDCSRSFKTAWPQSRPREYQFLDGAATDAFWALSDEGKDAVGEHVEKHEAPLRDDCSDGPCLALAKDELRLHDATYSCCGWTVTFFEVEGTKFVVGSCHGH